MEKLLPIVNIVLSLVAVVVCVITLLTVNGVKSEIAHLSEGSKSPSEV